MAELIKDHFTPSKDNPIAYLGLEHIEQQTLRISSIGKSSDITSQKLKFKKNDILFGKLRPYFRKVVRPNFDGICSTDIFVVRAKKGISQSFLYYVMASNAFVNYSSQGTQGTKMPRASWDFLEKYEQFTPTLEKQERIGKILSDLDAKIQNLQNQNRILEQIIQTIFQSWFVDFDGVTEFEDSELGQIPKGWSCEILDNFLERITYGFTCPMPTSESGPYMITAKDLKGNKINYESARKTTQDAFQNKLTDKSRPKYNDILLSKDGTLGRVAIVKNEKICINQSIALLQPNSRITTNYLYNLLVNPFYQQKIITDSDGSTIQHIYITRVNKMFIVLPTIQILNKFENLCHGIFTKIEYNRKNIIHLTKTRDALLPKLMSGEIRV